MKKSGGSSNRGSTYLEIIVSVAILGVCLCILAPCLTMKATLGRKTACHQRAIAALVSQADLLRSSRGSLVAPGRHEFMRSDAHLQGLPRGRAHYEVGPAPTPGLMQVRLRVEWEYRGVQHRELTIHVRR